MGMNLEESLVWFKIRTKELEEEEASIEVQTTNAKFARWLDELHRHRLFLSEY